MTTPRTASIRRAVPPGWTVREKGLRWFYVAMVATAGLVSFPVPLESPRIPIAQHWGARFTHDAASRWLRTLVSDLFKEATPAGT